MFADARKCDGTEKKKVANACRSGAPLVSDVSGLSGMPRAPSFEGIGRQMSENVYRRLPEGGLS